jgi:hypothetical protein
MDAVPLVAAAAAGAAIAFVLAKFVTARPAFPQGMVLYYHSACKGFTGRADAIVRMLEHAGCAYECKTPQEVPASSIGPEQGCFAVPFVQFPDGLVMSQSQAIHQELGKRLGLYPKTPVGEAKAMQIALNAADMMSEGAKNFAEDKARLGRWLANFEATLASGGSGFLVGDSLTYADFAAYSVLKLNLRLATAGEYPRVEAFVKMMDALPSMSAYNAKGVAFMPASFLPAELQ